MAESERLIWAIFSWDWVALAFTGSGMDID
jgi:hypothetical protein